MTKKDNVGEKNVKKLLLKITLPLLCGSLV